MSPTEPSLRWRHRARVVEAAGLLLAARVLVDFVPFRKWRGMFGGPQPLVQPHSGPVSEAAALGGRRVARAVAQAAARLPFECKCLPRAMAALWMLQRRKIPAVLVFGVAEAGARGGLDDLHAWVSCGGQVIVGEGEIVHNPVLVLGARR